MNLVGDAEFLNYAALMRDAHDTFEQKIISWQRAIIVTDRYGEDVPNQILSVPLSVQCVYNFMRSWPITNATDSGELDRESVQIYVNKQYLAEMGYINTAGYFDFNPDLDRFIIDGLVWKPVGDTAVAQAGAIDILVSFILKREETPTGLKR